MGGFNPANGLNATGALEGLQTRALPNTAIPNSIEPIYPRIYATGTLGHDIQTIQGQYQYYGQITVVSSTTTNTIWYAAGDVGNYVQEARQRAFQEPPEAEIREWRRREQTEIERRNEADARACELLESCLDAEQLAQWRSAHTFNVETNGRRYRLARDHAPCRIDAAGAILFTYCIHTGGVPRCDELLAHKLLLEANEDYFLRTANATITQHGTNSLPFGRNFRTGTPVAVDVQLMIAA